MTPLPVSVVRSAGALRQIALLLGLWWRHMRRRAARVGEAPKTTGVPGFLLINLISIGYLTPLIWRTVLRDMEQVEGSFAWHLLGMLTFAFGNGATKAAGNLQVRGARNDAFLEPLPLRPLATLVMQLADGLIGLLVLAPVIALAGAHALDRLDARALLPVALDLLAYVACFALAYALVGLARAFGPQNVARPAAYAGIGLSVLGIAASASPLASLVEDIASGPATALARAWLHASPALYLAAALVALASYRGVLVADRAGFDRMPVQLGGPPKVAKQPQSYETLEWLMMWRNGGKVIVVLFTLILCGMFALPAIRRGIAVLQIGGLYIAGFAVYLGALLVLSQAGRAVRQDLSARPFLSALPLTPYQVLAGKARALRRLVLPLLGGLLVVAIANALGGRSANAYRALLALAALYVSVDGAIGIAFLSSGIGIVGIGGGQAGSSFSTQLLMMPLLTTVLALDHWVASVAFVSVVAVSLEAKRAARLSVRWLDDADEGAPRETTVWRALLAATAFFAMQALTARLLDLFAAAPGYMLAAAFGVSGAVLALLTYRNSARFEAPRFLPRSALAWPMAALGGGASGLLAIQLAKVLPALAATEELTPSGGELIAIFVTLVVLAPLAEEYFFRGWLQKAIEKDLPERFKPFAFAVGALAFALAHIGTYGLPQLILGLIAGALYAFGGGLWPAMLAHAMHNGVVLLYGH